MASKPAVEKIWFITGASSGLGLEMSLAALRAGHRVIGTGRNIQKAALDHPEFENIGGRWLQLDVAQPEAQQTIERLVSEEEERLKQKGPVDWVVVNNAGNTLLGVVEDMSEGQISQYLQTNVFGFIRVWKAMIPALRRHRTGTLVTISSIWGFVSKPEHMMYSAVKATTESLTESYAGLLAPFGVRTMIVEPGGLRTKFAGNNTKADGGISDDYKQQVTEWIDIVDAVGRDATLVNGDPKKFGASVVNAVEERGLFADVWAGQEQGKALRLQLGSDCYALFGEKLKDLNTTYAKMADIAKSTDVDT
ncbi:Fc.00g074140.m01.CDS01 [Cosmosporella sp. VM-42]